MTTVQHWTGAQTKALRQAMRLSIRAFAARLGVDTRTVNKWEARGNTITLLPDNQALLDTALARAPEDVKTRFTQTLNSNEQQQHTNQTQPVERAIPHTTTPTDDVMPAAARQATQGEGTEQLVARLYAMYARAAAMQSRAKECHLALDAARDTLCNCRGPTRAGWIAGFDEASLAGESALCFYSLGALDEAENEARKVIELRRASDRVRSRAFGQLTLANVLFKAGAVDEAARVGSEICLVARSLSSARVRSGLSRLGESFGVNRAVPDVALFLDHLTQLTEKSIAVSHDQTRWPL